MNNKFAVFGNPIEHSLSPGIHQQFAVQHGLNISYEKLLSSKNSFKSDVESFFGNGGNGCNVTMPLKEVAFELCDELTDTAARANAVNTLYKLKNGKLCGHNTDGYGLLADLTKNLKLNLKNRHIVILGAGGATRGILQPLISQSPASLSIVNRTHEKAQKLAEEFSDIYDIATPVADELAKSPPIDILINATSASLGGELPISDTSIITKDTHCYDLAYASEPTSFLIWCKNAGSIYNSDGRGMLVEQAGLAFTTWTSLPVDTSHLIESFEELIGQ